MNNILSEFGKFWALSENVWETGVFGRSIGDILIAFVIFGIFYALRGLFAHYILSFADRWVKASENTLDDSLRDAVVDPLKFLFLIIGVFFATQYLSFSGKTELMTDHINRSLIVIAIFWTLRNAVEPLGEFFRGLHHLLTPEIVDWMVTGARVCVILIGAATVLQIWGVQVAPIIAGLGLFGVAVALGAQDLFRNLIGGISILMERRFGFGDWIKVDGVVEGMVEKIGFRSTLVRRFDKAPVYVPNQSLSDNAVTNFSAMTYRRISWSIRLEYRTTHDQLRVIRDGIEEYLQSSEGFVQAPEAPLFVRIDSFNTSSIDILVYCFTYTIIWGEWLELKEKLAFKVKEIVESADAGFALPSQSVYVETVPPSVDEIAARRANETDFVNARRSVSGD
jgi:MscS family membrane protein